MKNVFGISSPDGASLARMVRASILPHLVPSVSEMGLAWVSDLQTLPVRRRLPCSRITFFVRGWPIRQVIVTRPETGGHSDLLLLCISGPEKAA